MITLISWIAVYVIGGLIIGLTVNAENRHRFGENLKGEALKRGLMLWPAWPLVILMLMIPPTRRYVETGSFKR